MRGQPAHRRLAGRATFVGEATVAGTLLVLGRHPGIVAGVSQILADAGCSIVDINQTVVQGKFAMVIIANTSRSQASAA